MSDLERWADQLRAERIVAKRVTARIRALEELILSELRPGETVFGATRVDARKFSASRAKEVLKPADYDLVCDQVPNAKKVAELLGDDVLELCKEPIKPSVRTS